jgi:hypothetical protein
MKLLRTLLTVAAVCGLTLSAQGDSLDFKINVLDPPPFPILPALDITSDAPFNVTFGGCPQFIIGGTSPAATGCFLGINDTGQTITSLELTFQNTTNSDPNDFITVLNGQAPTCDISNGASLFGQITDCGLENDLYDLGFAGGSGIPNATTFYIAEAGPDPSAFGTGTGTIGFAAVPEPNSMLLLSTGMMVAGILLSRRSMLSR